MFNMIRIFYNRQLFMIAVGIMTGEGREYFKQGKNVLNVGWSISWGTIAAKCTLKLLKNGLDPHGKPGHISMKELLNWQTK